MVSDNLRIDELILQVFEDHEDIFFWPVNTQKEAKNFVKLMHDKGAPYEDIGKEIGEFEHNFSAWRKGLGRVGIGSRMLERINKTVEEVILSDGEDDTEHNLKLLSKINQREQTQSSKKDSPKAVNGKKESSPPADPKQQKADITQSMMKNIDKVSEKMTKQTPATETVEDKKPAEETKTVTTAPKSESVTKSRVSEEKEVILKSAARASPEKVVAVERRKSPSPPAVVKEEKTKEVTKQVEEKRAEESSTKSEVPKIEVETQQEKEKIQDPEVDEVNRKMEAIKRKVESMKKAKAEAAAAASRESVTPGDKDAKQSESERKIQAMKKRMSDLRDLVVTDKPIETEKSPSKSPEKDDVQESLAVPSTNNAPLVQAEDEDKTVSTDDDESCDESTSSSDLESDEESDESEATTYFSDIDPENYDSDLDFELNQQAKKLYSEIETLREKTSRQDGPGQIYIFADNSSSSSDQKEHRLMVGVSRSPDKKYAQARKYNPSLKQVSSTAVDKRHRALKAARKALQSYKVEGHTDWYQAPVEAILQRVSAVTEKFGSGPALVSFSSKC